MIAEFPLTVLWTQVVVHLPELERPGLLWSDDHVAQGFAWSPGIACFGVPDHDGRCRLQIDVAERVAADPAALWAVQTPFEVPDGALHVGTIAEMRAVAVPPGTYDLVFEALPGNADPDGDFAYVLRLRFVETRHPDFAILKRGDELATDTVLRRDAELA